MNADSYLRRVRCDGPCDPTLETLRRLHRAHMESVPFENLDIPLGTPIVLSLPAIYAKIVTRNRGGFCYELNGLFAWLIREMGFDVTMLSARVFSAKTPGPEFDHMLLLVDLDDVVVVDVGFGDSFVEPIRLGDEQSQLGRSYRFIERDAAWVPQRRRHDSDWEPRYMFSLTPRRLEEFESMCHYQQTSPVSSFTRKSVCSRATPEGRITLSNGRLIVTTNAHREERVVADVGEYRALLAESFGIDLGPTADLSALLQPAHPA